MVSLSLCLTPCLLYTRTQTHTVDKRTGLERQWHGHHPFLLTLYSGGPFQGSVVGMLFGISVGCFSSLPWTLELILDSVGCVQEVGMLTLALQSR